MKKKICLSFTLVFMMVVHGQEKENQVVRPTVTFISENMNLNPAIQKGFLNIIYEVYPKLVRDFNPQARQDLTVKIDTAYQGVAYAHRGQVVVSSRWLEKKPEDLDLMTHEVMHIIQSYPSKAGPSWLTEGIADFVRYKYGVDNIGAGWSLPDYHQGQSYKDSYRVTARFLLWLTQNYDDRLVFKLDKNLRNKTYSLNLWKENTGKTLDELWESYSGNPDLSQK